MQGYEFSGSQNALIGDLAKKMNFVGILMIAGAILGLISGFVTLFVGSSRGLFDFSSLIQGVLLLLIGLWTRNAAQSFKQVVYTTGADIENLLGALGELRKLYTLQYWLTIIVLIFLAIALILALVFTFHSS
ncbi:MAG: hypothetical protein JO235_03405 [Chroococcidiopsidaceae cyanobacterium CP_BM_RX_35]|nr:hypothetical protein [Chroococcidiopsidaceae cyanobacterium CP_BM_RX_35]